MEAYGISTEIIAWTRTFLTKRKQKTVVNGKSSPWEHVVSGVPQGSVLGPILFVIYINDLPARILSNLVLFADDSKAYRSIQNTSDQIQLQTDLHRMYLWTQKWLLKLHPDKLKCLTIKSSRKEDQSRVYYVGRYRVKETECEKDLGVEIDNELKFSTHINSKIKKANSMVGAVRRSFRYLDIPTFRLLYKGLIRCHLEYAVPVWSPQYEGMIEKVEGVQRRATMMLPGMKGVEYPDRLKTIGLPTLKYRRQRADMIETHKMLHNKYERDLCPSLKLRSSAVPSRLNSLAMCQNRNMKAIRRNVFSQRIVPVWNSLPDEVVTSESTDKFKANLDKHWTDQDMVYQFKSHMTGVMRNGVINLC
jgi:hypothetical protein